MSSKKITKRCPICETPFIDYPYGKKYCSTKCSNKGRSLKQTGSKNSFYGSRHTEETKKIISEANKGREVPRSQIQRIIRLNKSRRKKVDINEIFNLYWNREFSLSECADHLGCDRMTVYNRMREFGIATRSLAGSMNTKRFRTLNTGNKHPNYINGTSQNGSYLQLTLPHDHFLRKKYGIRKILEHREIATRIWGWDIVCDREVHHIDGDPANNSPENLFPLSTYYHNVIHRMNYSNGKTLIQNLQKYYVRLKLGLVENPRDLEQPI